MVLTIITILYTLILSIILVICNVDPDSGYTYGAALSWADLSIVKETFYLNLLLGSTITLGWGAYLVDIIIITWCKTRDQEVGFWDEAVIV